MEGQDDIALRAKSFALLSYLVRARGRVVTKEELLSALWPDVTVTEDSLTQCVHEVRRALGPDRATLIRTVARRGYLFETPPDPAEERQATAGDKAGGPSADPVTTVAEDRKPDLRRDGIAVLPLVLTSGDPADARLLDGLVHDVISRLARLRSFHVIARGSTFAMRHLAGDPQAAGRALGVAYALNGTADMQDGGFRLYVDLVHVESGAIVWTDTLTGKREQFLAMLPELTHRIVHSVEMQVTAAEARRALSMPEEGLDAWENFHAGLQNALRFDQARMDNALAHLRRATDIDPGFARAHAGQSFCHYFRAFSGIAPDRTAEIAAARRTAEDALFADDANPTSHWALGRALWLEGDADACRSHCEHAVTLSPGFALGHYMVGFVETHGGDARRGLAQIDRMLSLSPFDPFLASAQITRAIALVRLGHLDDAAVWARQAALQPNVYPLLMAPASLILASAGELEDARRIVAKLRMVTPDFTSAQVNRSLHRMSDEVAVLFRKAAPLIGL
jgi:TolB-like protein